MARWAWPSVRARVARRVLGAGGGGRGGRVPDVGGAGGRLEMRAVVLGLCLLLPAAAGAAGGAAGTPGVWRAGVAFSTAQFHYEEFVNGATLDREYGLLPGLAAEVVYTRGRWFGRWGLHYHGGTVNYDGQTQGGVPVDTDTGTEILDTELSGGYRWLRLGHWSASVYGGLGYRHWDRDIHSSPAAYGVFETYQWGYGLLGMSVARRFGTRDRLILDARATRTIGARVAVDFGGVFDPVTLEPADRFAGRLSLRLVHRVTRLWSLQVGPYVEWWRLGESPGRPLVQGGSPISTVFEPRSDTRLVGFELGVLHRF